ncbi:MBL fold metallo-hydrolase [Chloroflexota bacterium]
MSEDLQYHIDIEWLPHEVQHYHGPHKRMTEILRKHPMSEEKAYDQRQVIKHITTKYHQYTDAIDKIKFYRIIDDKDKTYRRFLLVWCNYNVEAREEFFLNSEEITASTGWYPVITGRRSFHHQRHLLDFVDNGLKKAMNKSNIEKLPGFGNLVDIIDFCRGPGTSILLKTTTSDLILDSGMPDDTLEFSQLRSQTLTALFVSHSHKDHTGGLLPFVKDKNYVIAITPISLELFLNTMSGLVDISTYLPKNFFYRIAPMWYRSVYKFADGSSVETIPTYHFPGSAGYLFTFSDGKTLFYSGDLNVSASYLAEKLDFAEGEAFAFDLGRPHVDYGIIEGAFVGRKIGSPGGGTRDIFQSIANSLANGRNHLLLTPANDYGLFLFLYLYDKLISRSTRKVDTRLFVDPQIVKQLEIIEWRLKRKQKGSLDDSLLGFFKKRSTLAESVRLYDFTANTTDNLTQINDREIPSVFILDDQRYADHSYLSPSILALMEKPGLDISRVGKAATLPTPSDLVNENRIANFDGNIWLLHSSEKMLIDYLLSGKQSYGQVYLFHNFKRRFEKFIKQLHQSGYSGKISSL